jgi:hypothetical protein
MVARMGEAAFLVITHNHVTMSYASTLWNPSRRERLVHLVRSGSTTSINGSATAAQAG